LGVTTLAMARRYLSTLEAHAALTRGSVVECFLGKCERNGRPGIKWLSLSKSGDFVRLAISGGASKFVNAGVVQDEYADFIARERSDA